MLVLSMLGCGGDGTGGTPPVVIGTVQSVAISPETLRVGAGLEADLVANLVVTGGVAPATTWTVVGPHVIVDLDGRVWGVAGGTSRVVATAGGRADTAVVVVNPTNIDFETYPRNLTICGNCDLTDGFSIRGVLFGFLAPSVPSGHIIPARIRWTQPTDPLDAAGGITGNHSVTMGQYQGNVVGGQLQLSLPTLPTSVVVTVRGENTRPESFVVRGRPGGTVTPLSDRTYTATGGCNGCVYRELRVHVFLASGLTRVDVGDTLTTSTPAIDDLSIGP